MFQIKLARAARIDEDRSGNHTNKYGRRETMRETRTQCLPVWTLAWQAYLALLLILLIGSDGSRVAAKDEVKNNPPQISSVFPQGARCGSQLEVTITGQNLSRTEKFIFSEPGASARLLKTATTKAWAKLEGAPDAAMRPP